jgi:hypothetical protein
MGMLATRTSIAIALLRKALQSARRYFVPVFVT